MATLIEPALRSISNRIGAVADKVATFDQELNDDNAGTAYKTAIKARIKAALQAIDTDFNTIITALG